jgi:CheY-like chemotaxis protein
MVVEDEPVAAEAHRNYVDRTPGFSTAAVALTGAQALDALIRTPANLVLLDMNLPDTHGIELCRRIRGAGIDWSPAVTRQGRPTSTGSWGRSGQPAPRRYRRAWAGKPSTRS